MALFLRRHQDDASPVPEPIEHTDEQLTLAWAGVTDGCELLVDEFDPEEKKRAKEEEEEREKERQKKLEAEQLSAGDKMRAAAAAEAAGEEEV